MPTLKYRTRKKELVSTRKSICRDRIEKLTDGEPASDQPKHVAKDLETKRLNDLRDGDIRVLAVEAVGL